MTDRLNTIAGWVLFSGVIALGLSILSGMFFQADKPHAPEVAGYPIEAAEEEGAEEGPSLAVLLAGGDAAEGEASFAKCQSCHTMNQGGANGIGPNLYAIVGKPVGKHIAGFAYSGALSGHGGDWTFENLDAWLASPKAFAPGTKMSFAGLSNPQERANVILYMLANGGGPALPAPPAPEAAAEGEAAAAGDPSAEAGPAAAPGADAAGAVAAEAPAAAANASN
ncbi:MAG: cytochrome c family protein [Sphingomonadales bacterium 32-68-7]|nr:MAG: cytochrome c family protein [Sphingomonadales bacterium 12-68-11]OYX09931.1 MAG: cytochrome c family protein [Sphingomonadales bacterium 32-68-7]